MSYCSFFWVIALLPVDFGESIWKFLLQITERMILNNENFVAVGIDCEGKWILVRGENDDKERIFSFETIKVYSVKRSTAIPGWTFSSARLCQE